MSNGSIVTFSKAVRAGSHVIVALVSESGGGKTYSAILLGRGLVGPTGRLALLDTETGRGKIYAQLAGGYDYGELTPPFTPERYVAAIDAAEQAGYECLIIDSASHEWEGIGGIIEAADNGTSRDGKPLQGLIKWAAPKARHKRFVQSMLTKRMHLIVCLRAKEKLVQRGNEIVSHGFVPIQDKSFKYEMTVQLFLPMGGKLGVPVLEKCPQDLLGAFPEGSPIEIKTGELIAKWVASGEPVDAALQELKRSAEEKAGDGSLAMREWWKTLTEQQTRSLRPFVPNLQSIAKVADEEIAAELLAATAAKLPSFGPVTKAAAADETRTAEPGAKTEGGNPFTAPEEGTFEIPAFLRRQQAGDPQAPIEPDGDSTAFSAAQCLTQRFCEGFVGGDVLTMEDLDEHRSVAREAINACEIEDDEKELLLGQLNVAYLERKKTMAKLAPKKARAA